jgi:hypothetical protein
MRRNFKIIFLIPLFITCGLLDSNKKTDNYFPLEIGNKWYYSSKKNQELNKATKWEVIDKTIIKSNEYYVIEVSPYTSPKDTLYYCKKSDKIIELHLGKSENNKYLESTFASFNLRKSEKFFHFMGTYDGKDRYFEVSLKNRSDECISFYYDELIGVDEEHSITFQNGKGISEFYSDAWGNHRYLIYYELK